MANLKSGALRTSIGGARARLETHVSAANNLLSKPIPTDSSNLTTDIRASESLIDKLDASITTLAERDEKWLNLIEAIDVEIQSELLAAEEAKYNLVANVGEGGKPAYLDVLADAKEALAQLNRRVSNAKSAAGIEQVAGSHHTSNSAARKSTKLPKLALPTFSGDPLEWHNFYTIFKANVGDANLTPVEKLSYLRGQLTGDAKLVVDGLEITDDSYDIAVGILMSRFERQPAQIINYLYSEFKKIKPSSERTFDLRRTHDQTEKVFRQLKAHGEDVDSNHSLIAEILTKYPKSVVTELTRRYNVGAESTATETQAALVKFLKDADMLSELFDGLAPYNEAVRSARGNNLQSAASKQTTVGSSCSPVVNPNPAKNGTSALTVSERPKFTKPPTPCLFCEGNHFNAECTQYVTSKRRQKRLETVNRCGRCFSPTHQTAECRTSTERLKCFYCKDKPAHKSALCPNKFPTPKKPDSTAVTLAGSSEKSKQKSPKSERAATTKTTVSLTFGEKSLLSTAATTITNTKDGTSKRVRIVLDSGSHRSYVTERLVNELNADVPSDEKLQIAVFGSNRLVSVTTGRIQLDVSTRKDASSVPIWFNTTPVITDCHLLHDKLPESVASQVEALKYAMADDFDADLGPPEVLIGSDYFWQLVTGASMSVCEGVYFIPTVFGLILGGRYECDDYAGDREASLLCLTERSNSHALVSATIDAMSQQTRCKLPYPDVDEFWSLEKIGISDDPIHDDDAKAMEQFNQTIQYQDGRYQVCWPWNGLHKQLPTNYQLTLGRFRSLARRLTTCNRSIVEEYGKVIANQEERGIIEKVPPKEVNGTENIVHYLPHHPVVKMSHATTKTRIVYDASARYGTNVCLNDCMYRGPVILPDLCAILLRFRTHQVAIIADIEKAFLQLGLQHSERDVTRFLWFKNPTEPDASDTVIYRFARVPFGVISSPFLLGATIQHHLQVVGTQLASQICDDVYVDNVISGTESHIDAHEFYSQAKQIFSSASMNLREWCSNSEELMDRIPSEDRSAKRTVKLLGLTWNSKTDQLRLQCDWKNRSLCHSKREVLKSIATIYDPLGFFQPCTLRAKCFLRKLWLNQLEWDAELDDSLRKEWTKLHSDIAPIFEHEIQRKLDFRADSELSLVVFSDASGDAYATSIYLRTLQPNSLGTYTATLIYAKSRLAPMLMKNNRSVTIPRLELLGLAIGATATQFVRDALNMPTLKTFLLTDSMVVLGWIQSDKPLPVFVANRVKKILQLDNATFLHVSGNENPADLATRGLTGHEMRKSALWWNGPSWLQLEASQWPTSSQFDAVMAEHARQGQPSVPTVFHTILAGEGPAETPTLPPLTIDAQKYSSFRKLVRLTVMCLKFLEMRLWKKLSPNTRQLHPILCDIFDAASSNTVITSLEIKIAKRMWIKHLQQTYFSEVLKAIATQKPHQLIKQLDLKLDDHGILRCHGRLTLADLPRDTVRPTLLPKNDYITSLIIKQAHENLCHSGVSHTLNQIRREYWILHGRNAIRKFINRCIVCRKGKGPPFALPRMPPWPRERVAMSAPFQFTGVDYFGPVNVSVTEDNKTTKMWVALFTCITVRAVHLEPVQDCSSTAFIDCISRFISRRGAPEIIISDNAPQFRLAKTLFDRNWQKVLSDSSVLSYISEKGITWKSTTALAPWQGGIYERLVGVVKSIYKSAVGRRLLKLFEFQTLLAEVEAIVNSRPLTYVYSDVHSDLALRPVDFLTPQKIGTSDTPSSEPRTGSEAAKLLLSHWKYKQRRLDALWRQFYDEYLTSLRESYQLDHRNKRADIRSSPQLNEVVIVKNPDAPRGTWKLGKVTKLIRSKDDAVRSVELQLPNRLIIERPISHLYPLEVPTANPPRAVDSADDNDTFSGFEEDDAEAAASQLRFLDNLEATEASAVNLSIAARPNILDCLTQAAAPILI